MELVTSTLSTRTEPGFEHPVRAFLDACGLDTSTFPVVKFMIETSEKELRSNRICIPLRIPEVDGVYESFFRVTRVMEVPTSAGAGHRKFVELEWLIEPEIFSETDIHPATSFLASEMSCPSCRTHFIPNPIILGDSSVKISCPQCLQQWTCKLEANADLVKAAQLLLDLLRKDPTELRKLVKSWEEQPAPANDAFYYNFFPYSFEKFDSSSAMEWLVGEAKGWTSAPHGQHKSFENLIRGFLNTISFEYIKRADALANSSLLEKTDIQVKVIDELLTLQEQLDSAQYSKPGWKETQNLFKKTSQKSVSHSFSWEPKEFTLSKKVMLPKQKSRSKTFMGVAAGLMLTLAGIVTFQYIQGLSTENIREQSQIEPIKIAEVNTPAIESLELPKTEVKAEKIEEKVIVKKAEVKKRPTRSAKLLHKNVVEKLRESIKTQPAEAFYDEDKSEEIAMDEPSEKPHTVIDEGAVSEKKFESSDEVKETAIEANYRKGMLHLKFQQGSEAAHLFEQNIKQEPQHATSYRGLGIAYFYDKKYERSIEALEKYLKVSTDAPDRKDIEEMLRVLRDRMSTASLAR